MHISVVIPTYNREAFVGRTVESVLAQTCLPEEILVVDDGSRDNTEAIIRPMVARTAGRVRYLYRPNGGLSAARNTGIVNAAPDCDALLFLDSDDLLEPKAVSTLKQALLAEPDACLSFCRARYINADDRPLIVMNTALIDEPTDGDMWKHLLRGNCIRTAGGVLIRRDALNAVAPFDETLCANEDWDMWLRLAQTGKAFALVPEPLLLYRIHSGNMSGNRAVMRETAYRVYEKQLAQHTHDPEKVATIRSHYNTHLLPVLEGNDTAFRHAVLAGGPSHLSYDAAMRKKHGRIRTLIERTGIASLYRRTPMAWRVRLRVLFGIDPNA